MQDSYRELFLSESEEYLNIVSNCLVKLEDNPSDLDSLNEIFRCMHTLKGMSATMGFDKLTQLSHQMENLLDELRSQRKKVTSDIIDILFATVDILVQLVEEIRLKQESKVDVGACLLDLKNILSGPQGAQADAEKQKPVQEAAADILDFNTEEQGRIQQAQESALNIFKIKITIVKDCVMKEARIFLVVNNLNKLGTIAKAIPALERLRAGQFDQSFEIILVTKETGEAVRKQLQMISELESIEVNSFGIATESKTASVVEPVAASVETEAVVEEPQAPSSPAPGLLR